MATFVIRGWRRHHPDGDAPLVLQVVDGGGVVQQSDERALGNEDLRAAGQDHLVSGHVTAQVGASRFGVQLKSSVQIMI